MRILAALIFRSLLSALSPVAEADALFEEPRTLERVRGALKICEAGATTDFDLAWRAARACAWLAKNDPDHHAARELALKGVKFAEGASRLRPRSVEGCYFEAVNLGHLSRLERTSKHLSRMEELAKQALALDETFEHGAPHRFLGLLYHDASGYPFVGVGSMKEAEAHLRRACAMAPDYGYNQLALAK